MHLKSSLALDIFINKYAEKRARKVSFLTSSINFYNTFFDIVVFYNNFS